MLSWVDAPNIKVHVMRYEDMKQRPLEVFTEATRFARLSHSHEQIKRALALSSFDELQRQEKQFGFREKDPDAESFFREGQVGVWRRKLTSEQADRIIRDHGDVMERFDYLTEKGKIIF